MEQKNHFRSKKIRFILAGTLAITSLAVSAKLFTHTVRQTDAQVTLVKDDSVTTADVPEAIASGEILPSLSATESKPLITTYKVKSGDTLSTIAESFGVSTNTIRWANDLTIKSTIKVGQELVILPFNGIQYRVKKGDTLSGIILKYGGDEKEIMEMNGLESAKEIKPGDMLLIPDGEMPTAPAPKPVAKATATAITKNVAATTKSDEEKSEKSSTLVASTKFTNPIPGGILTQGIHDGNAVDFGAPIGTSILATASGTVLIAKMGYNGGYGNYIVINHDDGSQTLYAHLSKISVTAGQSVTQNQEIGKSGNSGKSTGAHLHYKEINTGTKNTFSRYKKGTQF